MRILIIEDEPLAAKDLEKLIKRIEPSATIDAVLTSVSTASAWLSLHTAPDLILSDIQLSDGVSFDIYEHIKVSCPIIFTTAFDEYAIRAFKLNSIDYLLKPIDEKELTAALNKYKALTAETILANQLKDMIADWSHRSVKRFKERFLNLHGNTLVPVGQEQVAFFHKEELIYLHTIGHERYISEHQTMDEIESLVNPEVFFRVNRQYILHIQSIGKIRSTHKGLTVQLKSPFNNEIDISREKAMAFKSWVSQT